MGPEIEISKSIKGIKNNNLAYITLSQLIVFITGFIKLPLYTYLFSPSDLGNYALVTSSLNYIDIILLSWVSSSFWRFIYESDSKRSLTQLLSIILPILIVLIITGFLIVFLLGTFVFHFNESLTLFFLGFLSIVFQQFTSLFYMVLQSKNQIKKWCITIAAQSIFTLLLFVILVLFWQVDLKNIFLSTIVINSVLLIIWSRAFPNAFSIILDNWKKNNDVKKLLIYSIQATIVNVLLVVLINADRFIISIYKGASFTGIYSQIYNVAFIGFAFVIQAFTNILLPFFNKSTMVDSGNQNDSNIIKLYLLLFTPACVFLIVNSREIIYLVLSKSYHQDYAILPWVAAGIYFYGLANFYEIRLKLLNKINIVIILLILIALLNISCNLFILKDYGIKWAAIITFVSYSVLLTSVLYFNRKELIKMNFKYEAIWLLLISVILVVCILFLKFTFPDLNQIIILLISLFLLFLAYFILFFKAKPVFLYCLQMLANKK